MRKIASLLVLLLAVPIAPHLAEARVRGGTLVGPFWGAVGWGSPLYPYPAYPSPPIVIQQPRESSMDPPSESAEPFWYYCSDPRGYYPYVKQCRKGWQKVSPSPPPPEEEEEE